MKFTIIRPYYENPAMLKLQIDVLNTYPKDIAVDLILIDDGSPRNPALQVIRENPCHIPISLWRIKQNIPWNQHGARNLGAHVAPKGWILMADIDQLLLADDAINLTKKNLNPTDFYSFHGVSWPSLETGKWPPNQHLLTRKMYWESGGYNEDYCGTYGGDSWLVTNLLKLGNRIKLEDIRLAEVAPDLVPDACTMDWDRQKYKELYRAHLKRPVTKAVNPLRFDWERQL